MNKEISDNSGKVEGLKMRAEFTFRAFGSRCIVRENMNANVFKECVFEEFVTRRWR